MLDPLGMDVLQKLWPDLPWDAIRAKAKPWLAVGAFLGGFAWDAFTLSRIDRLGDNLLIGTYVVLLGVLLVIEHRVQSDPERWPRLAPRQHWVVFASQFFFGGLFSASLIFYARSASWGPSFAYVAVLGGLLLANEFLHGMLRRTWLRLALYWVATFTWLLFFVPVTTTWPGPGLLLAAGVVATGIAMLSAYGMFANLPSDQRTPLLRRHAGLFGGLLGGMLLLDTGGMIPPVPLAAVEIGIFHGVERRHEPAAGRRDVRYWLKYEKPPWYLPLRRHDRMFRWREGEKAHCFTAIFAPTGMKLKVFHLWERLEAGRWVEVDRIDASPKGEVIGGADNGFRTWTAKAHLTEGEWRCRAVTASNREISRAAFEVVKATQPGTYIERAWD